MRSRRRCATRVALMIALLVTSFAAASASPVRAESIVSGRILFVRDNGIWVWSNGDASKIVDVEAASDARWSPDATRILFVKSGNSYSDLVVYNISASAQVPLTYNQSDFEEGTLDYVNTSAWAIDPDWASSGGIGFITDYQSPDGTFQLWLIDDVSGSPYLAPAAQFEDNIDSLSLSSDSTLAAYVVQERQLDGTSINRAVLRDLTDGIAYPLAESKNAFDPAISPDAQTVAVAIRSKDGMSDIFTIARATGKITRVTRNLQATNPTWSPDGKWIAFIRMVDYEFEVWVAPVVDGNPGKPVKLFKAKNLDARSGLSWTYIAG